MANYQKGLAKPVGIYASQLEYDWSCQFVIWGWLPKDHEQKRQTDRRSSYVGDFVNWMDFVIDLNCIEVKPDRTFLADAADRFSSSKRGVNWKLWIVCGPPPRSGWPCSWHVVSSDGQVHNLDYGPRPEGNKAVPESSLKVRGNCKAESFGSWIKAVPMRIRKP